MVAILFCQSGRVMGVRLKRSISSSKATMVESGSMHGQLGTRLLFEELVMGVGRHKAKRKGDQKARGEKANPVTGPTS